MSPVIASELLSLYSRRLQVSGADSLLASVCQFCLLLADSIRV